MLKFILLFLLFISCSSFGIFKDLSLKYRFINLKNAEELLFLLKNEISFSKKDIYSVAEKLTENDGLSIMQYMSNRSFSPSENYLYAKSKVGKGLCLEKEDWEIIDSFFLSLGKSSAQTEILLCEKNGELLKKQKEEADKNYRKNSKLYASSGILAGLFLVIILI